MLKINKSTIIYFTILKNIDTRCYKKILKNLQNMPKD